MSHEHDHDDGRWRAELAAYALGSLEEDEQRIVEQHLEDCQTCREELDWLQPAIDLLPESVAQLDPPPDLRERLLAAVRSEAAQPAAAAGVQAEQRKPERRGFVRGFLLRPATGLAAVALIAAGVGGYALNEGASDSGGNTTTVSERGAGALHATLERRGDSGVLKLTGLQQATPTHVYEAWVQRGSQIKPTSLFDARHNGTASVSLENKLVGADAVMVTLEPRGGSRQPTSPPVINVATQR
jgi:anti-sigma-K factor RskA